MSSANQEPNLKKIMEEIEAKTERKVEELFQNKETTIKETTIKELTDTIIENALTNMMQKGAEEFKERTGRHMTYSEMRQMYG